MRVTTGLTAMLIACAPLAAVAQVSPGITAAPQAPASAAPPPAAADSSVGRTAGTDARTATAEAGTSGTGISGAAIGATIGGLALVWRRHRHRRGFEQRHRHGHGRYRYDRHHWHHWHRALSEVPAISAREASSHALIVLCLALLTGCSAATSAWLEAGKKMAGARFGAAATADRPFSPDYRYIRATVDGLQTFLVFGGVGTDSVTERWFSADGEVLRLRDGRIVGTAGIITDWRAVEVATLPSWRDLARNRGAAGPFKYQRTRDVMPDYAYGLRETVVVQPVAPPRQSALQGVDPDALRWFQESSMPERDTVAALPPALFAVEFADGQEKVVYSEQCLSDRLCLTLQAWPAAEKKSFDTTARRKAG